MRKSDPEIRHSSISQIKLPGSINLGDNNYKVISAACHCEPNKPTIPIATRQRLFASKTLIARLEESLQNVMSDDSVDAKTPAKILYIMSLQRLKWGEATEGIDCDSIGHLGFGTEDQNVITPVEGRLYT